MCCHNIIEQANATAHHRILQENSKMLTQIYQDKSSCGQTYERSNAEFACDVMLRCFVVALIVIRRV